MAKLLGLFLTITRKSVVASALAMTVALPMWSSSAVAQNDIRTSVEDGGDTVVERTYDDKTGKLLEVVKDTDARDPNDRTKILRKVTTKKYDQGTRPPYETTSSEQEIILDGRKSVMRRSIRTRRTYKKTKDRYTLDSSGVTVGRKAGRDLVIEVKEEKELVGFDANGVPIYRGTRVTTRGHGYRLEKNEAWDAKTGKWMHPSELKRLEAWRLERERVKQLNQPKITKEKPEEEAALKDKPIRKEDIKKNKDKKEETNRERRQARGENPKPKPKPKPEAGEDRIVEADEGGMLVGKSLKLSDFEGCGAVFLKFDAAENFGWVSTSCPGLTGGRVATQADYLTYCNSFDRPRIECRPPGPGTEKRIEKSGIQGMPFSAFCIGLHFNVLAIGGDAVNKAAIEGKLVSAFKYDNGSRNLECFYVSFAQSKALRDRYKNTGKDANPAGPVAEAKPKNDCKPGSGLAGAANCVTERIEGAGTPPDSAPPTIKNGNQGPKRNKDRSPAYASSTDPDTGETITSVGNPDGSRTVTKTDKYGNILSKEKAH